MPAEKKTQKTGRIEKKEVYRAERPTITPRYAALDALQKPLTLGALKNMKTQTS